MFNIGGGELLVIMLIALIVLGPQRLPDAARQIGKTMGDLRRLSTGFQNEMRSALDTADDPNRVASRRNVLAKDGAATEPSALNGDAPVTDAIAAVSAQPAAPAKKAPPAAQTRTAARKAPLKAAPAKKPAPAKKAAAAKKPAPAKKAVAAKKPAPATKKAATSVPKASPRRSKG